ncbi:MULTISPECIES: alpha-E domain-containing protein [unclassified Microcoleus]|uniref:alpha-E domain-containing protein n=1 Tax=unclassified Microcoleus TaxID=2642155 RepID=UPI0040409A26
MLSGVADSIYGLNRYIERSENIAHFAKVNFNLILDSPSGITQLFTDRPNECTLVRKCQADAQTKSL